MQPVKALDFSIAQATVAENDDNDDDDDDVAEPTTSMWHKRKVEPTRRSGAANCPPRVISV